MPRKFVNHQFWKLKDGLKFDDIWKLKVDDRQNEMEKITEDYGILRNWKFLVIYE